MPVNNKLLKRLSSLDPIVRGHTEAIQYMKALPDLTTKVLSEEDLQIYSLETEEVQVPHW